MKKLSIICAVIFALGMMVPQVFAVELCKDFEPSAPLVKECDENIPLSDPDPTTAAHSMGPGGSVVVDVILTDVPCGADGMTGAGFWLDYDDTDLAVTGLVVYDGGTGGTGYTSAVGQPNWLPGSTFISHPAVGAGTMWVSMAAGSPPATLDGDGDMPIATITFLDIGVSGQTDLTFAGANSGYSLYANFCGPPSSTDLAASIADNIVSIDVICECTIDADCDDGEWCTGEETCDGACNCLDGIDPCIDTACITEACNEGPQTCDAAVCDGVTGPSDPCCAEAPCDLEGACGGVGIIVVPSLYTGDVGIKVDLCLDNQVFEVGGIQVDVCDTPDCLECVGCELSERTVLFDCFVNELDNGCCRVILISKAPGGVINPGICNIVKIDFQKNDNPDPLCDDCIEITVDGIVSDPYGRPIDMTGTPGEICPVVCGDVHPSIADDDCGDEDVDLMDIMTEVDLALGTDPTTCQCADLAAGPCRADVPTGTPGRAQVCAIGDDIDGCCPPDGDINILDIMVLIDMALSRQDCCSYYYQGIIY